MKPVKPVIRCNCAFVFVVESKSRDKADFTAGGTNVRLACNATTQMLEKEGGCCHIRCEIDKDVHDQENL